MNDSPDLLAFLKEEEVRARNEYLQMRAETNLRSYKGEYYGDEVDGRSKAVARDVAEVIDHMEVAVLRAFVSGDRVVEFEPLTAQDAQAADDATEVMRRDFSHKGYMLLHDWFKEGNISVLGIVKSCVETKKVKRTQVMSAEMAPDDVVSSEKAGTDAILGEMVQVTTIEDEIQFVDRLVPLEEFRFSPDAHRLEDAPYLAHATLKTISDLIEMDFDVDNVDSVSYDYAQTETPLAQTRSSLDYYSNFGMHREGPLRQVVLMEEYVRYDLDGDGIAERLCVHRIGDTILRVEEVDYQPFRIYCPFPMPGRIDGEALAEKVSDIQRINTALMRVALDGLYCNLAPGYLVPDSAVNENTLDDLLTVRPNRIVRYSGNIPPIMEQKQDVSATAFNAIEFMIGQRESRTGVTRMNQGLDADALNKTATGTALMQAQGQQMEEYLARNFAESVSELMKLKYRLYKQYSKPIQLRVDGQFRVIDPSTWPDDMDIIIRVGLGSGKKEGRLAARMTLLQIQQAVMQGGLSIVGPAQIYKSIAGVVRDASLGSPADYVVDPATQPPQPPQPSPQQMAIQAEIQLAQAKLQSDQQIAAAKLQGEQQIAAAKVQLAQMELQANAELARAKLAGEMGMAQETAKAQNALAGLKARGVQLDQANTMHRAKLEEMMAAHKASLESDRAAFEARLAQNKAHNETMLAEERALRDHALAHKKVDAESTLRAKETEHSAKLKEHLAHKDMALKHTVAHHTAKLARDTAIENAQQGLAAAMHGSQMAEDKAQHDAHSALRDQQFNHHMAARKADMDDHMASRKAARADAETKAKLSQLPGGFPPEPPPPGMPGGFPPEPPPLPNGPPPTPHRKRK